MDKIICDKMINTEETNFNQKNIAGKTQNFNIVLTFLLIQLHY